MTTYKYYDEDYINKCMDLISKNLQFVNNKFSYCSIKGNTMTSQESKLLKQALEGVQECVYDIGHNCRNKSYMKLQVSLKRLNDYYNVEETVVDESPKRTKITVKEMNSLFKGLFD